MTGRARNRDEKHHRPAFHFAFTLIGANPGISPAELARSLLLDKSRASELIDDLEKDLLICRRRSSEDQRRQGVYLTPAGTARLAALEAWMRLREQPLNQLFTGEERRAVRQLTGQNRRPGLMQRIKRCKLQLMVRSRSRSSPADVIRVRATRAAAVVCSRGTHTASSSVPENVRVEEKPRGARRLLVLTNGRPAARCNHWL